ncbi:SCO family protein [candidate division GN15 bacterium]|nr:SCO family protein [candidate division GN15 bacterium]
MNRWMHIIVIACIVFVGVTSGYTQLVQESPRELQGIDVKENLGDTIDLDIPFFNEHGEEVTLADYVHGDRPVILILGYYRCPMLCNLVFNGVADAISQVDLKPHQEYQIVAISINPEEGHELATSKKQTYMDQSEVEGLAQGWAFLSGPEESSRAVADAIGFEYYWVESRNEYAHPAVITLLSPEGVISRYLYGIKFKPNDIKLGLMEAADGKIGSTIDRIILSCFHYDPDAGSYVVFAGNVMRIGGILTVIIVGLFLGAMLLREKRRRRRSFNKNDHEKVNA